MDICKVQRRYRAKFLRFLHKNRKTFVGLGPYSKLSSFLPRPDLFVPCARGKLFFKSIKTHQLPCGIELICALIRLCSQEEKNQEKLANAIGISSVELLNLRQLVHDQLSGTIMAKAWMWLKNTPINEISEKFGINSLAFMNILSSYRVETADENDENIDSSESTETASIGEMELMPGNKIDGRAQKYSPF